MTYTDHRYSSIAYINNIFIFLFIFSVSFSLPFWCLVNAVYRVYLNTSTFVMMTLEHTEATNDHNWKLNMSTSHAYKFPITSYFYTCYTAIPKLKCEYETHWVYSIKQWLNESVRGKTRQRIRQMKRKKNASKRKTHQIYTLIK